MKRTNENRGMILLVVLGMLTLFSLLTVTFVLFSSQSRSTNIAFSRRMVRETETRPLLEESIKQLIRGTTDANSAMWGHDILGDLYGANETTTVANQLLSIRSGMTYAHTDLQRPMLLGAAPSSGRPGRFLRIPFQQVAPTHPLYSLLSESDALTGRIITFPYGQGPLGGQSFRVIRHVGDTSGSGILVENASQFSITIDLSEADLGREYSQSNNSGGGSDSLQTRTLAEWADRYPPVQNTNNWASGVYLCYRTVSGDPTFRTLADPYQFYINAMPLNGHGIGIGADGSSQIHRLDNSTGSPLNGSPINDMAVGLIPNSRLVGNAVLNSDFNQLFDPSGSVTPRINGDVNLRQIIRGDSDEPIDAADYNSWFLSHTDAESGEIIPSFHRAELINYIVNFKPLDQYSELEFWATIRRIQLATLRPLSMNITTPSGTPSFMDPPTGSPYLRNAQFNVGDIGTLTIEVSSPWNTNWSAQGIPAFREWLNRLTGRSPTVGSGSRMTWDVDNLGTGMPDSIWLDLGLPLQRTADGKLLKSLVAYYVEDLDGKIDINAAGSAAQANMYKDGSGQNVYFARPTYSPPTSASTPSPFALGTGTGSANESLYLNQGLGYGPADISFRHLLGKPNLEFRFPDGSSGSGQDYAERAYRQIIIERYQPNTSYTTYRPGSELGHDAISQLNLRETRSVHRHGSLPGLPMGVRGRVSVALDRLGNPILHNYDDVITSDLTEYAARLVASPHQDSPFSLAEWERIYRVADADRANLPDRVQRLFGETDQTVLLSALRREITPISRSLRVPLLGARNANPAAPSPQSFWQLINTVRQLKGQSAITDYSVYEQLFPLEFRRGAVMNLNRPFGNGIDDHTATDNVGFGMVDEPIEIASQVERAWDGTSPSSIAATAVSLDYSRNATLFEPDYLSNQVKLADIPVNLRSVDGGEQSRQLFARHLYCLAQLLVPEEYAFPNIEREYWKDVITKRKNGDPAAIAKYIEIRSRILAQWSVNVVDFRDADATMTRFTYDPDPFNTLNKASAGWFPNRKVNGVLTGELATPKSPLEVNVAWGMEQPELLLTESLAFHDLRIRKDPMATMPIRFDQFRMPEGSLFLELYCPRTTDTGGGATNSTSLPGVPRSLYDTSGGDIQLDLSRLTPKTIPSITGTWPQFPVWRVYISNPQRKAALTQNLKSPNDRLTAAAAKSLSDATRFDLTYQIANSNIHHPNPMHDWSDTSWISNEAGVLSRVGGQKFDFTTDNAQRLREPDPTQSRIILFTRSADFMPSSSNCPGVAAPQRQVYYNREASNMLLQGNQYMVVGPRKTTYLGSRTSSEATPPINDPSRQKIELTTNWAETFRDDGTTNGLQFRNSTQNVRSAVTMIAAADRPQNWAATPPKPTIQQIGISVSEPLPNSGYYAQPTEKVNSDDNAPSNANFPGGFGTISTADGYHDYKAGPPSTGRKPFDDGTGSGKPLRNWEQSKDADGAALTKKTVGANQVVSPGTAIDWCTAYLQRLADPDRPWHAVFNPYLTVDWIPIDLTVFSGEEDDAALDIAGKDLYLASRQKSGQMIETTSDGKGLEFNLTGNPGNTFLSTLTHGPRKANKPTAPPLTFLKYEITGDVASTSARPSASINDPARKFLSEGGGTNPAFATLGFLNSTFKLAAESATANLPGLPPVYVGAPGIPKPVDPAIDRLWYPATVYWPNRLFVNQFELSHVPISSPAQIGHEFSATIDDYLKPFKDAFEPAYLDTSNKPNPTSPQSANANSKAKYPFAHLLNLFQEAPELSNSVIIAPGPRHSKDTGLAMFLEMLDTPSPWADVEGHVSPAQFAFQSTSSFTTEMQSVVGANNFILAPLRAPYNRLPLHAEPGKVNLNTVSSSNVLQGLLSNILPPSDVVGVIDHNNNGLVENGSRALPDQAAIVWNDVTFSRMGYALFDPIAREMAGFYNPVNSQVRKYSPHFPSRFAGAFKPSWEAGMVPKTRNPYALGDPDYDLAQQYGGLDVHSRQIPGRSTVMRTKLAPPDQPLFADSLTHAQRHPLTDLYPISRLQKMVTERSNVFAVYATVGLFEYDEAINSVGSEYGRETGQTKRLRAFYVIDRTIPVGYRVGEDHNVEKTILIRRMLAE